MLLKEMEKKKANILLCTLDEDYKNNVIDLLSDYSVCDVKTTKSEELHYFDIVIVDSFTFNEHSVFSKYENILFYIPNCTVIMTRPDTYNAYPDILRISTNIIITELDNILSVIDVVLTSTIGMVCFDDFIVDSFTRKLYYKRKEITKLTPMYFYILQELIEHYGELVTAERLMELLYGMSSFKNKRSIDVMIKYIRSILNISNTVEIKTVYAEGYILKNKEV